MHACTYVYVICIIPIKLPLGINYRTNFSKVVALIMKTSPALLLYIHMHIIHTILIVTHCRPYRRVTWMEQEYMLRIPYVKKTRYACMYASIIYVNCTV